MFERFSLGVYSEGMISCRRSFGLLAGSLLVLFVTALVLPSPAEAQENAGRGEAQIVYAVGDGFTVVEDGEPRFYEADAPEALGLRLKPGNEIQTENGTFLEISLLNSGSIVKIAENTTFRLKAISRKGGGRFDLAYGRIRAKVNRLVDDDDFSVTSRETVAGVRGTDFGYDVLFERQDGETTTRTRVYCFEGAVEVTRPAAPEAAAQESQTAAEETDTGETDTEEKILEKTGDRERVLISANEMVNMILPRETRADDALLEREPLVKEKINPEVEEFWLISQPFSQTALQAAEKGEEEINPDAVPTLKESIQMNKPAAGVLATAFLGSGGAMIYYGGSLIANNGDYVGGTLMGLGGAMVTSGAIYIFTQIF